MKSSAQKKVLLLLILIVPALILVILSTGTHHMSTLPVYGPKEPITNVVDGKEIIDTTYHTIKNFEFTNQYNEKVSLSTFDEKIFVVDYFFVTCQSICPKMSGQMAVLQEKFRHDSTVMFLSHTVNPEADSVSVLKEYAEEYGAMKDKWHIVTGNKKELYDMARNSYFITAMEGDGGSEDFIHSEKFILIDQKNRIRAIFDGTSPKEVIELVDNIKLLRAQGFIPRKGKQE
jgi:protein SCO1/2